MAKPFAVAQVILDESAEAEGAGLMGRDGSALAYRDQFDEGARKLDDPVLGAPGMPVARADLEAEALIEVSGLVEIMDGNDEMVDPAGHQLFPVVAPVKTSGATVQVNIKPAGSAPRPRG